MITKNELAIRICQLESDVDFLHESIVELEKKIKQLEPKKAKVKKVKK